jgi:transcriptional regulator with XRE-family HTH domain
MGEVEAQTARKYLGSELSRLRRLSGLSGRDLAARVGISQSKVSRIESGTTIPTLPEVTAWADAAGISNETRDHLIRLTEAAYTDVETWRSAYRGKPQIQDETQMYETTARTICNFHPAIVPGLLQTAEYTRRVLSLADRTGIQTLDYGSVAVARARRQEILYDETRRFEFLITEAALRWQSYDSQLLLPQLDRIASASSLRNVRIGLLPYDSPIPGIPEHNFQLYSDRDDDQGPVVRVELLHARLTISDPQDVAIYQEQFARWSSVALYDEQAREFLRDLARDLRPTTNEV